MKSLFIAILLFCCIACEPEKPNVKDHPPSQAQLSEIRQNAQAFISEKHPELTCQGFAFTPMTPTWVIVGASVTDKNTGNSYTKQFTAVCYAGNEDEDAPKVWVVDYATRESMNQIASHFGISEEIKQISDRSHGNDWFETYLMWHFLFNRPSVSVYNYGHPGFYSAGNAYASSTRTFVPPTSARQMFAPMIASSGGTSKAFTSGTAYRVPGSSLSGKTFTATGRSTVTVQGTRPSAATTTRSYSPPSTRSYSAPSGRR